MQYKLTYCVGLFSSVQCYIFGKTFFSKLCKGKIKSLFMTCHKAEVNIAPAERINYLSKRHDRQFLHTHIHTHRNTQMDRNTQTDMFLPWFIFDRYFSYWNHIWGPALDWPSRLDMSYCLKLGSLSISESRSWVMEEGSRKLTGGPAVHRQSCGCSVVLLW